MYNASQLVNASSLSADRFRIFNKNYCESAHPSSARTYLVSAAIKQILAGERRWADRTRPDGRAIGGPIRG